MVFFDLMMRTAAPKGSSGGATGGRVLTGTEQGVINGLGTQRRRSRKGAKSFLSSRCQFWAFVLWFPRPMRTAQTNVIIWAPVSSNRIGRRGCRNRVVESLVHHDRAVFVVCQAICWFVRMSEGNFWWKCSYKTTRRKITRHGKMLGNQFRSSWNEICAMKCWICRGSKEPLVWILSIALPVMIYAEYEKIL